MSLSELGVNYPLKGDVLMNITISGKNIEVTSGLKSAVNEKLAKLERYFTPETHIMVTPEDLEHGFRR